MTEKWTLSAELQACVDAAYTATNAKIGGRNERTICALNEMVSNRDEIIEELHAELAAVRKMFAELSKEALHER